MRVHTPPSRTLIKGTDGSLPLPPHPLMSPSILGHLKASTTPAIASAPGNRVPAAKVSSARSSFLRRFKKNENDLEFGCAGDCEGTGGGGMEELDDLHEEAQEDIAPVSVQSRGPRWGKGRGSLRVRVLASSRRHDTHRRSTRHRSRRAARAWVRRRVRRR